MEFHYNAFISYRHAELDSKVAEDVQKQLERYHIPGAVQKETGIRRINRIFRDKSELPLTSDLNEDILNALRDADYLILICSPRTKESLWVRKEVETFLETHGNERVLTVLAEGEPGDVIPSVLLQKTIETVAPDGQTASAVIQLEPLSCDYRIGFRRARQTEIPRLAAALIGCRYDELIRRQRQYQIRIRTAAAALMAAAAAWLFWSNIQIRKNLNASLISQSRYLAAESTNALNNYDRMLAVQLAMEALPNEKQDRPVTPEALYALSSSLNLYRDVQSSETAVTARFSMDNSISDFVCDGSGRYLAVLDTNRHLQMIDTQTAQVIREDTYPVMSKPEMLCMGTDRLLVKEGYDLHCYDFATGEEVWCQQSEDLVPLDDIELMENDGQPVIALQTSSALYLLDGRSAEVLEYYDISRFRQTGNGISTYFNAGKEGRLFAGSATGEVLLPYAVTENNRKKLGGFLIADRDTGSLRQIEYRGEPMEEPTAVFLTDSGNILVCGFADYDNDWPFLRNINVRMSTTGYSYTEYTPVYMQAVCLSRDGQQLWHHEITAAGYGFRQNYFPHLTHAVQKNGTQRQVLCVSLTNAVEYIDCETGEVLSRYDCSSVPVCQVPGMAEENEDAWMLENGEIVRMQIFENRCLAVSTFMDGVTALDWRAADRTEDGKARFFVLHDGDVYLYQNGMSSSVWKAFDDPGTYAAVPISRKIYYSGDRMLFCGTYDLRCYDRKTGRLIYTADFRDEAGTPLSCTPAGFSEERKKLYLYTSSLQLLAVDTEDGTCSTSVLPSETTYPYVRALRSWSRPVLKNGLLYYAVCYSEDVSGIHHAVQFVYDPENETVQKQWLPDEKFSQLAGPFINESGTQILYLTEAYEKIRGCIFNTSDSSFTMIEEDSCMPGGKYDRTGSAAAAWNNTDGSFAVLPYLGSEIRVFDKNGKITGRIQQNSDSESDLAFRDGRIFSLIRGEYELPLNIYDAETGIRIVSYPLEKASEPYETEWNFTDSRLILRTGNALYMIDKNTWTPEAFCPMNCYGFDEEYQRLIAGAGSTGTEAHLGYYPLCSVGQMTEIAREFTGTQTMSSQEKAKYGLN